VPVNIMNLIDDVQCYQTVRELRWPDGVQCPSCESQHVIKGGFDDTEPARQRYACHYCNKRFDDLTDTIFAGHHQPLKVWILYLYFMGRMSGANGRTPHPRHLRHQRVLCGYTRLRPGGGAGRTRRDRARTGPGRFSKLPARRAVSRARDDTARGAHAAR